LEGHTSSITTVAFSQDRSWLEYTSHDQTVQVWDASTGAEVQKLEGHSSFVSVVAFSPDASLLASTSHDQTV
ncbi:uncharacterized protein HMPREF1541_06382, partial [Cyphellophora europaea CBS 101466]